MSSYPIQKHSSTLALVVLVLITVASWAMNRGGSLAEPESHIVVVVTMTLSFLKAGVIIAIFMEVIKAPVVLKMLMSAWLVITCVALTVVLTLW